MKHLKTFEGLYSEPKTLKFKYGTGDYVKLDYDIFAKIIQVKSWGNFTVPDYYCEIVNITNFHRTSRWIDEDQMERRATPEEIESIQELDVAKKYNL